jgi:hypothetical protein
MSVFHYISKGFVALLMVLALGLAGCSKSAAPRNADDGVARLVDYAHALVAAAALEEQGPVRRVSGLNYTAGDIPLAYGIVSPLEGEVVGILFGFDATDFTAEEIAQIPSLVPLVFALLESGLETDLPDPVLVSTASIQASFGDALGAHNFIVGGFLDANLDLYIQVLADRVSNPAGGTNTRLQIVLWIDSSNPLYLGSVEINDTLTGFLDFLGT